LLSAVPLIVLAGIFALVGIMSADFEYVQVGGMVGACWAIHFLINYSLPSLIELYISSFAIRKRPVRSKTTSAWKRQSFVTVRHSEIEAVVWTPKMSKDVGINFSGGQIIIYPKSIAKNNERMNIPLSNEDKDAFSAIQDFAQKNSILFVALESK
jgi:hypothetical protein